MLSPPAAILEAAITPISFVAIFSFASACSFQLIELARKVGDCRLSAAGLATLRARALAVSGTDARVGSLEPAEDAEVNGLVALSQSVATRVSQLPMYKHAFNMVLQALSDEKRHEMDMMKMMGGWES